MLKPQILQIHNTTDLAAQTGQIKCKRALCLTDCGCIATTEPANAKAVFARKGEELVREMERKPFNVEMICPRKRT
jgi:membrane protease subunit (stomatin/prohibitin family)